MVSGGGAPIKSDARELAELLRCEVWSALCKGGGQMTRMRGGDHRAPSVHQGMGRGRDRSLRLC